MSITITMQHYYRDITYTVSMLITNSSILITIADIRSDAETINSVVQESQEDETMSKMRVQAMIDEYSR